METLETKDIYKTSRVLYIIEAALEYFISLLVTGAYLAKITSSLGMSDSLTGILTSFVSLGCGFQIIAIFLANKRPVKRWVTLLHSINQLAFALIYLVPFIKLTKTAKIVLFIVFLLVGHIINNVVNSPKINWFMSLVDDGKRGRFTAKKEVISLILGVAFNFAMGTLIEKFEANGNLRGVFIVCGVAIFGFMILHTLTMLLTVEKEQPKKEETLEAPQKSGMFESLKDKNVLRVTLVFCLWQISNACASPFYGAYKENDLGFDAVFGVAILGAIYAVARSVFSFVWGKYADKYSFASMLQICFTIAGIAFLVNSFCRPENGRVVYPIYYTLNAIAMGGINSALINLCYDYVTPEKRTDALAVSLAISGVCGFLTTLAVSPIVSAVQANSNIVFGMNIYAQQILSVLAFVMTMLTMLYVTLSMVKKNKSPRAITLREENEQ
jgi:MFS family permease